MKDQKPSHIVMKGVNWVHNDKLGLMVLKGVSIDTKVPPTILDGGKNLLLANFMNLDLCNVTLRMVD